MQNANLHALARYTKSEDGRQVLELLRAIAELASPNAAHATDWGHINASFLRQITEADGRAFEYCNELLSRAATFREAEF